MRPLLNTKVRMWAASSGGLLPCKRRLGEGELVFVHPSANDLDYCGGALDFAQCSVKSVQRAVEKVSQITYLQVRHTD